MRRFAVLSVLVILAFVLTGCTSTIESLGDKAFNAGKYKLALRAYQYCLKRELGKSINRADILYYKIGLCLENLQMYKEAIQAYKMVLKINPISRLGADSLKRIVTCTGKAILKGQNPKFTKGQPVPPQGVFGPFSQTIDKGVKELNKGIDKITNKINKTFGGTSPVQPTTNLTAGQIFAQIKALEHQYNRALERGDLAKAQEIWNEKMKLEKLLMQMR